MNILYCTIDLFGVGGIQRYSRYELDCLERIVALGRVGAVSLAIATQGSFDQPLPQTLVATRSGGKVQYVQAVAAQARTILPDLIIADHINIAPVAMLAAAWRRIPYIVNVYGLEVWRTLPALRRLALTKATAIMSDCEFTKNYLLSHYHHLPPIYVIEDPVDCERYRPGNTNGTLRASVGLKEGPVLLTVSRLEEGRSKGHDVVMQAMARLIDELPTLQYLIVGDGNDRPRLEALAEALGLRDRITFAGRVDDAELPALYHACDLFILVSRFQEGEASSGEGVPLVVLEAQASGRAVITSKLDGSAESIIDGESGLLVDPHDDAEVARAIQLLLTQPDVLRRMGACAVEVAQARNDLPVFEQKISRLLTAVMKLEDISHDQPALSARR